MTGTASASDKQLGLTIVFGVLVLAGAVGMLLAPGELLGAAGFAVAIAAGLALVAVFHLTDA